MIIKNVKVFQEDKSFRDGEIIIEHGIFVKRAEAENAEDVIDGEGCYAIPGLIDLHFHGCMGYDFCDGNRDAIEAIARYEASVGVTGIAPATMTLPVEELVRILAVAAKYKGEVKKKDRYQNKDSNKNGHQEAGSEEADLLGINMEGPFISPKKKGAQDERHIIPCDVEVCERFLEASGGLVKFVGIAPEECAGALGFIRQMKDRVAISLAHTNADYDTAKAAFDAGASHAVHLYNAMPPFTHRAPGVVGAVADSPHVMAELICDGVHIHPAAVRATFRMLGEDRVILVSDSMRATGMPNGRYTLGGLEVEVEGNRATLVSDGALAGSVTNLMDCVRTAVQKMGIPLETAVACAAANPAKALGVYDRYGSITPGKKGNVVLLYPDLSLKLVVKDGRLPFKQN